MRRKRSKHNEKITQNYLENIPVHSSHISWSADENGAGTLDIENRGVMNRIAQKLLKKPKVSHIHLDEMGSFIWPLIDGERRITDFGEPVEQHFGEKAHPLYERLAKFFQILESYHFIYWKNEQEKK